jgi:cytochrome oxidase assembly protein ShyY1
MKNTSFFLKIFSILLFFTFGFLSFWQYSRFEYKKKISLRMNELQKELSSSKHIILNKKLIREIKFSQDKLYFKKIIACGVREFENSFILQEMSNKNLKQYKIASEIKTADERILFIDKEIFFNKSDAEQEIERHRKKFFSYSCTSGLISKIPNKNYSNLLQRISDFNGFSDEKQDNEKIKTISKISKKELNDKIGIDNDFLVEAEYSQKLEKIDVNQNHHIFYMIMWFLLSLYMAYFSLKLIFRNSHFPR